MQVHASCAARDGAGVLLLGAPGAGKSDLLLRLLDHGYALVADDRVDINAGIARAPAALAGLIEVRGLGVLRLPYCIEARLALCVDLGPPHPAARLPEPARRHGLPLVRIDPAQASAPARVTAALRCVLGQVTVIAGAMEVPT